MFESNAANLVEDLRALFEVGDAAADTLENCEFLLSSIADMPNVQVLNVMFAKSLIPSVESRQCLQSSVHATLQRLLLPVLPVFENGTRIQGRYYRLCPCDGHY